ncbi:MAG: hypothetical protein HKN87_21590 [Saprospiraceae bacterium]|nr:hypothetical protein [Saprospiraceae bacterium]
MLLSPYQRVLFFLALSIGFRFWTFFPAVIDHDESTYIIIADQLLSGQWPYVHNIDVKPPAIYVLFAAILSICDSILSIRLLTTIVIGFSGLLAYKSHKNLFGMETGAMLTGVLFVFCASLHKWSWSGNTEIFFVCCSLWSLYLMTRSKSIRDFLWAGIILGIGFSFKYHILFDIVPYLAIIVWVKMLPLNRLVKSLLVLGMSFLIPILTITLCYYFYGHLDDLLQATVLIPSRYSNQHSFAKAIGLFGEFYLSFLPISLVFILGIYNIYSQSKQGNKWFFIWIIWILSTWTGILVTGKYYFHYLYQALIPFTFLIGAFVNQQPKLFQRIQHISKRQILVAFSVALLCTWVNQFLQLYRKPDHIREIASFIEKDLPKDKLVYTNDKNILYYLCGTDPPTRYVHTSLLYKEDLIKSYGIDTNRAFQDIRAKQPLYYVIRDKVPSPFQTQISQSYNQVKTFGENTIVYRRRD